MNPRSAKQTSLQPAYSGHHRSLAHLLTEYERARRESVAAAERVARFEETIRLLIGSLPSQEQPEFIRRFDELRQGTAPTRAGDALSNVVALFKSTDRTEWTVPEIHAELEKSGTAPEDQKALYNAINYLAKTGRLRRVSRGRYVVADYGFGIEHEDRDDGTTRGTEHEV